MVNNNRIGINNVSTIQKNSYGNNINQYIFNLINIKYINIFVIFINSPFR